MVESAPRLRVRTRALTFDGTSILDHLCEQPLTFIRDGQGLVGMGEVARLSASGPNRFSELNQKWMNLVEAAEIDDAVGGIGRGLIGFSTIAFAADLTTESVIVVPRAILGIRDDRAWVTQIWLDSEPEPAVIGKANDFAQSSSLTGTAKVTLREGSNSAKHFEAMAAKAIELLNSDAVEKVVLARDLAGEVSDDFDLRIALKRLAERYTNCWTYSVDGMFGASPELLVRVMHSQVSARVLAGTASRGTDPQIDRAIADALASSNKNKREHAYAVQSLVDALAPFCSEIAADAEPFSLALTNLWHLASDVTAALSENHSSLDLVAALHPTAAVAGTPTDVAMALIEKIEGISRGRYAGPVGWIGANGDGEWAIALRGAQLSDGGVRAFAGCGLVTGSEPTAELAETELKFQPIRYALS